MNDHEYHLVLDPSSLPTEPLVEGAMTWTYQGQATWTDAALEPQGLWWSRPAASIDAAADPERYYGIGTTRRYDALGRQWVLTAVDVDAVADKARRYDEATREMFGEVGLELLGPDESEDAAAEGAEAIWLEPTATGTKVPCLDESDNVTKTFHWNVDGEPLVKLDAPLGGRSRKILLSQGSCSATLVDDGWALTAAHCVIRRDHPCVRRLVHAREPRREHQRGQPR